MMILLPCDVLNPRRVDEHFAAEAEAARDAGLEVAHVDHDALQRGGGADDGVRRVRGEGEAVYRGWMLRSERYAAFDEALRHRGVILRTTAEQYKQAHELPGWYSALEEVTPESVWTEGDAREAFERALAALGSGAAVLRDYTKSMKHYWHEAAYVPDVTDVEGAWAVATRFRELRDDDFTGGFVLRRFERFTSAEVRTWWVGGECRLVGPHPDTPDDRHEPGPDLAALTPLVAGLALPFATVDLAQREDGAWRVVELGDGQVSDRPRTGDPAEFVRTITR
ncbi:hypothetical protein BJP25_17070 [Actinokineospora bangkokensis]|uniref:ATP-grasp domain-containing protein n=1 Tax=Actinokineospora bangkokensis TaxID=1193682 RepID=A0A1Q9LMH0_9PSEU|nr:hypothetical protein BJP25_17070 [Actinokineospora bangkokensis]